MTINLKQILLWRELRIGRLVLFVLLFFFLIFCPVKIFAQALTSAVAASPPSGLPFQPTVEQLKTADSDSDGLTDYEEIYIYHTDPINSDSDSDGYSDGIEVNNSYNPNKNERTKIKKSININLKTQTLGYFLGPYQVGQFLISSGVTKLPTPLGEYQVLKKLPSVRYKGLGYDYPNTKWNLQFKLQRAGNLYIHGAYWHHNFGHPMSHGCVNVSYGDMESLYNWADVGTKITIQ